MSSDYEFEKIYKDRQSPSTDQLVIRKEMDTCIKEYIDKLPHDYKTVIVLSKLEDLINKEIAESRRFREAGKWWQAHSRVVESLLSIWECLQLLKCSPLYR